MTLDTLQLTDRTCGQCEYFDSEFGDCLNRMSDRFQTTSNQRSCIVFYRSSVNEESYDA